MLLVIVLVIVPDSEELESKFFGTTAFVQVGLEVQRSPCVVCRSAEAEQISLKLIFAKLDAQEL